QIRSSRIICESSKGLFGSDFRLGVDRGSFSHFIFLERSSFAWLEQVCQVAAENDWAFPRICSTSTSRRTIALLKISVGGFPVIRISEKCRDGKVFFVLVPADKLGGWWSFSRLLSGCLGAAESHSKVVDSRMEVGEPL
ncbi:hypothetical protein LINPERHAP2_LOCUS5178, partial [Linum perenne]